VREQLGELLDLAKLVRHAFARLAAIIRHAERAQPRGVRGNEMLLGAIVSGGARQCRAGQA